MDPESDHFENLFQPKRDDDCDPHGQGEVVAGMIDWLLLRT